MSGFAWPNLPPMREERHFGDRTVRCFAERPRSLQAMLDDAARRAPQGEALVCGTRRWRWPELLDAAARVAAGLRAQGIGTGDRVLVLLGNRAEFVIACFALARLAAVAVPVSVRSAPPEVAYIAAQCGASLALVEPALEGHLPPGLPHVRAEDLSAMATAPAPADAPPPAPAPVDEEDTAVILYTSGTTGRPKGAMLTHLNVVHSAMHFEACMQLGPADRSLAAVPLSHVTGLVAQVWTMARCAGTLVLMDGFKAPAFLALAERERVTHTLMVPAMYQLCLLQADVAAHELSHWRIGAYGGAPMTPALIAELARRLPSLALMNAYGATETTSPATILPAELTASRPDSVGLAVPCGELRIADAEGRALPPGETGEIWIRGPMVVRGYWDNAAATAAAITDGWWHSGDLGRLDAQGHLQVLDRIKDVINRGGLKVYCSEVESVLAQHPAVAESAVIGFACPVLGERVRAFVSLRPGAADAGPQAVEAALAAHCRERLSDYKVPERWDIGTEPLPRNANGKLMKRELRERS
jgi:long-chain acyl-CoA synthetase